MFVNANEEMLAGYVDPDACLLYTSDAAGDMQCVNTAQGHNYDT